jgi:hypothetical protein
MAQNNYDEYEELGYEGTIENEGSGFVLLPDGDYDFTVNKVSRFRHEGSEKVPPCNAITVELTVWGPEDKTVISARFYLIRKFEWKLSQFFLSIGLKKHGEPLNMRWNIEGCRGKCKVYVDTYNKSNGSGEGQSNKIKKFYAYDEDVKTLSPQATPYQGQTYSAPQQTYQQPAQQTYQQPANGGWKAGSF